MLLFQYRNMLISNLIQYHIISFNTQHRGAALRVMSHFGESRLCYSTKSMIILKNISNSLQNGNVGKA